MKNYAQKVQPKPLGGVFQVAKELSFTDTDDQKYEDLASCHAFGSDLLYLFANQHDAQFEQVYIRG